ncbi:helix-turn-helix domain-containing protein [Chryseobacterium oryctis]|uniref:Helix-turn-helix domain-containing protein n=1 Tax=Chryseobacterium oryctis TaxID=2952618 RepID=A0ABT3HRK4_9FLAO|nr:helix-turn-helix domain-containing protein [Chryseobacterium oryctis]MCW3162412.1 helix-turn-helix domain-containing protein [Chryseobacterium oryctis]
MDKQIQEMSRPDYRRIYNDIIIKKHPDKKEKCQSFLLKKQLSALDIIKLNSLIFDSGDRECIAFNQKNKAYNRSAIQEILEYQIKNKLNNTQLASHFKLSRNTIAKWKKMIMS